MARASDEWGCRPPYELSKRFHDQADSRRPGSVRSVGRMFRSVSYPKTSPRAPGHSDARATSVGASPRPPERTPRTIPMTLASRSAASAASTARVSASAGAPGESPNRRRWWREPPPKRAAPSHARARRRGERGDRRSGKRHPSRGGRFEWDEDRPFHRSSPSSSPRRDTHRNIRRPPPPTGRFSSPRARPCPRSVRPPADPGARFLPCQVPRSGTLQA